MAAKDTEILEYLVSLHGGRDQVMQDMTRARMQESIKSSSKIGELLIAAEQGGWLEMLKDMSIDSLYKRSKTSFAKSKGKRIKSDDKQNLKNQILNHVKANPAAKNPDIAKALKMNGRQVGILLREMVGEGSLKKDGERAQTAYSVAMA